LEKTNMANPASLTITPLVRNGSISPASAQTIDTAGTVPIDAGSLTDRLWLQVDNAAANALTVTVKAHRHTCLARATWLWH
jgi:hypothetical protein